MTWGDDSFRSSILFPSFFFFFRLRPAPFRADPGVCIVRRDWDVVVPKSQGRQTHNEAHGPEERQSAPARLQLSAIHTLTLPLTPLRRYIWALPYSTRQRVNTTPSSANMERGDMTIAITNFSHSPPIEDSHVPDIVNMAVSVERDT